MQPLTTDPGDYCFFDTETRALPGLTDHRFGDIRKTSTGRYARSSKVIMFQYAIGETAEPQVWDLQDFDRTMRWVDAPRDLLEFHARALRGEAWYVAWNSAFDRNACNHGMVRSSKQPAMPIRTVLDASAQGAASNLPMRLDSAHKAIGGKGKLPDGKHLIQKFCVADGVTPQEAPEDWQLFCDYGVQDVDALRETFLATRPLWDWEWEQFWASEVINDRGLPIDRHYVERAAYLAELYQCEVNERVALHTRDDCWSVNQHVALAQWAYDKLEHIAEATSILTKRYSEDDEGELIPDKISLERTRVEKLIPLLERREKEGVITQDEMDVLQLLEVREYGASATPKKFDKMLGMMTANDRLPHQYVFNGAQQTGRYSARGVQTHNLTRKALPNEAEAIEAIGDIELEGAVRFPPKPKPSDPNKTWARWHNDMALLTSGAEKDKHIAQARDRLEKTEQASRGKAADTGKLTPHQRETLEQVVREGFEKEWGVDEVRKQMHARCDRHVGPSTIQAERHRQREQKERKAHGEAEA